MAVSCQLDAGVATVTLDRPERHHAFDSGQVTAFAAAVRSLQSAGADVQCVVLRGTGPSFCSGADLDHVQTMDPASARRFMMEATWAFRGLERLAAPVIASVHGWCLGGGLELALHTDVIVASPDARFGFPEAAIGLVTTAGSVERLIDAIGTRRARDLLLWGRRMSAEQAWAAGLVAELAADLEAATQARVDQILEQPRQGLAALKRLLRARNEAAVSGSWIAEVEAFESLLAQRPNRAGERP